MDKKSSVSSPHCSSSATGGGGGGDSLHGLNFGKKIYFEGVGSISRTRIDDGPPKSPAKKGRCAAAHGGQPPRCQVEGCNVDLSDVKAYYSRHKVCGMHSKSPKVVVAGIEQRFCQQCSRFHKLSEFDQGKRSCRRRLAGHNERRRKPPPVPLLSPHFGLFATTTLDNQNRQGRFLMNFNSYSNHHQGNYSTMKDEEAPWQSNNSSSVNPAIPNLGIVSSSSSSSEECYSTRVSDSSGALSLLSNHQSWAGGASTLASSSIGLNNFLENNVMGNNGQFGSTLWDFKGNEMCPDPGLAHMPHHVTGNNDRMSGNSSSQHNGGIGLSQQQASEGQFHDIGLSRGYDPSSSSSSQHINWLI